jgi:hypothetical protein
MFDSLFKADINWYIFIAAALILSLIPGISLLSYFAILVSIHQFLLVFYCVNYGLCVRYLFGAFMCLQMLVGPTLAYTDLSEYLYSVYRMQIPINEYFSYALPAVILFILGLNANAGKLKGEVVDVVALKNYLQKAKDLPYIFIIVGFFCSLISNFLSSELKFVFYLLAGFKFVGLFLLILSNKKIKTIPLILVFGSIISTSLSQGMFHDLLTWIIFLGMIYAIRYKPSIPVKAAFFFGFVVLATTIQLLKSDYRSDIQEGEEAGLETFNKALEKKTNESTEFFSAANVAPNITRINQGFILSYVMSNVPTRIPFEDGSEFKDIVQSAILPRFLAPNKLNAGDKKIFMKYSGISIKENTSMALGSLADGYINYGVLGGCIFMLGLGLLYNFTLKSFYKYSKNFPILLLFLPLIFYYPIRPDCELQTILGHLLKSCFLIFIVMSIWKNIFKINTEVSFAK